MASCTRARMASSSSISKAPRGLRLGRRITHSLLSLQHLVPCRHFSPPPYPTKNSTCSCADNSVRMVPRYHHRHRLSFLTPLHHSMCFSSFSWISLAKPSVYLSSCFVTREHSNISSFTKSYFHCVYPPILVVVPHRHCFFIPSWRFVHRFILTALHSPVIDAWASFDLIAVVSFGSPPRTCFITLPFFTPIYNLFSQWVLSVSMTSSQF